MNNRTKNEYKKGAKRAAIIILSLFPILIGFAILFYFVKIPDWLSIILIACIGGLFYIIIEWMYQVHITKKKLEEKSKPKKYDPFAD